MSSMVNFSIFDYKECHKQAMQNLKDKGIPIERENVIQEIREMGFESCELAPPGKGYAMSEQDFMFFKLRFG